MSEAQKNPIENLVHMFMLFTSEVNTMNTMNTVNILNKMNNKHLILLSLTKEKLKPSNIAEITGLKSNTVLKHLTNPSRGDGLLEQKCIEKNTDGTYKICERGVNILNNIVHAHEQCEQQKAEQEKKQQLEQFETEKRLQFWINYAAPFRENFIKLNIINIICFATY